MCSYLCIIYFRNMRAIIQFCNTEQKKVLSLMSVKAPLKQQPGQRRAVTIFLMKNLRPSDPDSFWSNVFHKEVFVRSVRDDSIVTNTVLSLLTKTLCLRRSLLYFYKLSLLSSCCRWIIEGSQKLGEKKGRQSPTRRLQRAANTVYWESEGMTYCKSIKTLWQNIQYFLNGKKH